MCNQLNGKKKGENSKKNYLMLNDIFKITFNIKKNKFIYEN